MVRIEKACPKCGSHNINVINYLSTDFWSARYSVKCGACGKETPHLSTKEKAVECWKNNCVYVAPVRDDD